MSQPKLKDLQKPSTKATTERDAEQVKGGGGIIVYKGSTNRG